MDDEREYGRSHRKYGKYSQRGSRGVFSKILAGIVTIVMAALMVQMYRMNMFPTAYLAIGGCVLGLMALLIWVLAFRRSRAIRGVSCVLSLLLTAVLGVGIYYLATTQSTIREVTKPADQTSVTQTDQLNYIVLKSSSMTTLNDLVSAKLGILKSIDRANTDKALADLQSKVTTAPTTTEYDGVADMVQGLYDKEVDAILLNTSYRDLIGDEFATFADDTKVLESVEYSTEISVTEDAEAKNADITKEPFIVYMSGIDTYGDVAEKSRSDVNILAVVNPTTKQILLVTTPRDLYVQLPFEGEPYDKLTHAGIYGINCSIKTLEDLYGVNIDHYIRMNFTGFMSIVDALGGVDVYSDQAFTGEVYHHSFEKGYNHVDGKGALSFVRERHSFENGDYQRQRNQLEMVRAVVNKICSPAILTSYASLMNSIKDAFKTDISSEDLAALVKMQLNDGADWNIETYGVSGVGARRTTYSMGSRSLYVALQDADSIAGAVELMDRVKNGDILVDADSVIGGQEAQGSISEEDDTLESSSVSLEETTSAEE